MKVKNEVIEFIWSGPGTVPTVKMIWMGSEMIFECPVAMMEAYQELQQENLRLTHELQDQKK